MVQIQIDLNKEENKLVNKYKAEHDLKTKAEAVKAMIKNASK